MRGPGRSKQCHGIDDITVFYNNVTLAQDLYSSIKCV